MKSLRDQEQYAFDQYVNMRATFGKDDPYALRAYERWQEALVALRSNLLEEMAALEHEQWSHWTRYLLSVCPSDGDRTYLPAGSAERWERQANTPYAELSEKEKDSDRRWAKRALAVALQREDAARRVMATIAGTLEKRAAVALRREVEHE